MYKDFLIYGEHWEAVYLKSEKVVVLFFKYRLDIKNVKSNEETEIAIKTSSN